MFPQRYPIRPCYSNPEDRVLSGQRLKVQATCAERVLHHHSRFRSVAADNVMRQFLEVTLKPLALKLLRHRNGLDETKAKPWVRVVSDNPDRHIGEVECWGC